MATLNVELLLESDTTLEDLRKWVEMTKGEPGDQHVVGYSHGGDVSTLTIYIEQSDYTITGKG